MRTSLVKQALRAASLALLCSLPRSGASIDWQTATGDVVLSSGDDETIGQSAIANVNSLASITVPAGARLSFDTDTMPLVPLKGDGEVRKVSQATWTAGGATTPQAEFAGRYVLSSGIVSLSSGTPQSLFGGDGATCVVTNGATLHFSVADMKFTTPLHVSGNGAKDGGGNDMGAVRVTVKSTLALESGLTSLILDDDALYVGTQAFYMNGTTVLNGHTLRKLGNGALNLQQGSMTGDAGGITVGPGASSATANLILKPNYNLGAAGDGPLTMESYSSLTMWNDAKLSRPVVVKGSPATISLYDQYGASTYKTGWTDACRFLGDIALDEGAELTLSPACHAVRSMTVSGVISGKGSLRIVSGAGRMFVSSAANTFEGGVLLDGNAGTWVQLAGAGSFPNYGSVTGNAAKVVLRRASGADSWTDAAVGSFLSGAVLTNGSMAALNVDAMPDRSDAIVFGAGACSFGASDASLRFGIDSRYQSATLTVSGDIPGYHPLFANTGRLRLTGGGRKEVGCLSAGSVLDYGAGSICIEDVGDLNVGYDGPVAVMGNGVSAARLSISNSVVKGLYSALGRPGEPMEAGSLVLSPASNDLSFVDVRDSVVSNVGMRVAVGDCSAGHYRQRGGTLHTVGGLSDTLGGGGSDYGCATKIGAGGCGSMVLADVAWTNLGHMTIGEKGCGTLVVSGGSAYMGNHPDSSGASGEYHINIGGSFGAVGHLYLTNTQMTVSGTKGYVYFNYGGGINHLTVGANATMSAGRFLMAAARWSVQTQMVNVIDGGRLAPTRFQSLYAESKYSVPTPFWINLNGGTLVAPRESTSTFLSGGSTYRQTTRVTVYGKGARIVAPYQEITTNVSIDSAPGNGIASVQVPVGGISGYSAIPAATVVGDGEGASVLPTFDPESGTVTGFVVTSPGWNYTEAKVVLDDKRSERRFLDCVLSANGAGAFRKAGSGRLTLGRANSWAGDTVLEEGALSCGVDGALPAGGTVVLSGGTLDMNGKKMSDGGEAPMAWAVDVADVLENGDAVAYAGDLAFAEGATLTIRNAGLLGGSAAKGVALLTVSGTVSGNPTIVSDPNAGWHFVWSDGTLMARRNDGGVLIIR